MRDIEKDSFVVISDFHSYEWPLKKITDYYLNEYDKIYILGDATDRGPYGNGEGGIDLLFKIKELTEKYPNRVIYIPGNHDEFVYGYAAEKDYKSEINLEYNHGRQTIEDINNLSKAEHDSLVKWLGNLPLQREHFYKGKRYVLAHAFFDQKTFERDPNFSLKKYRFFKGNNGAYSNILWFRKASSDKYDRISVPEKGTTMIIGHTPLSSRDGINLDLKNEYGNWIEVICVDGGIAYDGLMLKYSAAFGQTGLFSTEPKKHVNRGNTNTLDNVKIGDIDIETKETIDKYILHSIWETGNINKTVNNLYKMFKDENYRFSYKNKTVTAKQVMAYFDEIYYSYMNKCKNNYHLALKIHFIEVAMDYISKCQLKKWKTISNANNQMEGYLAEDENESLEYITYSIGKARELLYIVGKNNVYFWLENNNYSSYKDYLSKKFGKQYKFW